MSLSLKCLSAYSLGVTLCASFTGRMAPWVQELTVDEQWWWEAKRCYEAKIDESEKADSRRELNPGALAAHLACAASALQPNNHHPPQSLMYTAQVVLKCLSCTPGSHSVCAVRTPLGVDRKSTHDGKHTIRNWYNGFVLSFKPLLNIFSLTTSI